MTTVEMIPLYELRPPSDSDHIIEFILKNSTIQPVWLRESFQFSKDVTGPTGEGSITCLYDHYVDTLLLKKDPILVRIGWRTPDGVERVKDFIWGEIKDVKPNGPHLEVTFTDLGVRLEEKITCSYTQMKRSEIIRTLITTQGLKAEIDWGTQKDDVIDYHGETGASTSTDDGNCVTFTGYPQCGDSSAHPGGWVISTKKWSKKCPGCGQNKIQLTNKVGVNWPGHPDGLTCGPGKGDGGPDDNIGCNRDFCGICGKEAWDGSNLHLIACTEATTTTTTEESSSTDTSSTEESTTTDATQTTSQEASVWDMIIYLLKSVDLDMHVFVWKDTCYVQQIPPMEAAVLTVDSRVNVERDSVQITEAIGPDTINKVVVKYGDSAVPRQAVATHDDLILRVRKENVKEYDQTKDKWTEEQATAYAYKMLNKLIRDSGMQIDLTTIGHPEFYIARWARTYLERYKVDDTYYISRVEFNAAGNKALRVALGLREYAPPLEDASSSKKLNAALRDSGTLDGIGYEEAKFADVQGVCSNAACFVQLGYGDCWADAEWLYNKLNATGVQARIMGYAGGGSGVGYRHAWVQINTGTGWIDWNYNKYGSHHFGDVGGGTPIVLIPAGRSRADILSTGY